MKAYIKNKYGGPEVLHIEDIEVPQVKEGHLLIKVVANSVNPADWHIIRGKPFIARLSFGLFRPKNKIPGADFAGIVEKTGGGVTRFSVGDKVFGESLNSGVFAEYAVVAENVCALMPADAKFADMACLPIAGLTALQALVTQGQLKKGESVLVNGAAGGVGHFAVQIAKVYGAEVTAVCSVRNADFVKSLGADKVVAYDKEDIHRHTSKYDLILDIHGNLNFRDFTRMGHRGVIIGFTTMGHLMSVLLRKLFSKFTLIVFTAKADAEDLDTLARLVHENKLKVYTDRIYSYDKLPDAIGYIEAMRTRGKVAVVWE